LIKLYIINIDLPVYDYWEVEYSLWLGFFSIVLSIIFFLCLITSQLNLAWINGEENTQYECGFEPYGSESFFDVQYFLIGVLYMIFDGELVILLPWVLYSYYISILGLFVVLFFVLLLIVGLIYEIKKGCTPFILINFFVHIK